VKYMKVLALFIINNFYKSTKILLIYIIFLTVVIYNLYLVVVRTDYLKKKSELDKLVHSPEISSLNAEIKYYGKKLLKLTPIIPKVKTIHLQQ